MHRHDPRARTNDAPSGSRRSGSAHPVRAAVVSRPSPFTASVLALMTSFLTIQYLTHDQGRARRARRTGPRAGHGQTRVPADQEQRDDQAQRHDPTRHASASAPASPIAPNSTWFPSKEGSGAPPGRPPERRSTHLREAQVSAAVQVRTRTARRASTRQSPLPREYVWVDRLDRGVKRRAGDGTRGGTIRANQHSRCAPSCPCFADLEVAEQVASRQLFDRRHRTTATSKQMLLEHSHLSTADCGCIFDDDGRASRAPYFEAHLAPSAGRPVLRRAPRSEVT